ncbi:hypothetical protein VTJ49DRAFT_4543 [Mycothermus thermophilus]|uniref:Dihydrolipoamide acetyltransferase component of pyruvate dehydrogenase complex n=1 Tax=Humicola insolens TaxID=85995 RepID=A0ABR3V525_HUMIN
MFWSHSYRAVRQQWRVCKTLARRVPGASHYPLCPISPSMARAFHAARPLLAVKPVLLADIGEGIVECEIIQWFVEPGARVEEFSPLCEVQSDKASVEITSRFAGVVKKLYYEAGEMAKVGKPFVDIDIEGDANEQDTKPSTPPVHQTELAPTQAPVRPAAEETAPAQVASLTAREVAAQSEPAGRPKGKHATLATPAVRHLCKTLNVDISEVEGTGKDGRVLKEDIQRFVARRDARAAEPAAQPEAPAPQPTVGGFGSPESALAAGPQQETRVPLTRTQEMMFKTMTRSLSIPHFLYADEVDFTSLVELRSRLNKVLTTSSPGSGDASTAEVTKLSYLPFIIKAVSMALYKYPILNARVDVDPNGNGNGGKPTLIYRSHHNIGVAMDTPQGLLVPVIKNVGARNILSIASELSRLQSLARAGRLTPDDMSGGTITVSNIGSIGGTYLSPVVVEREVAILGVGRMRDVPAFSDVPGEEDKVVRRQVCNFSWSADHRVVDGATLARAAQVVRAIVEEPDVMVMHLR